MKLNTNLEYYPKVPTEKLLEHVDRIKGNKNKWDEPFFTDTKSYLDFNEIHEVLDQLNLDDIENVIVLGTGGSIQTFLALKHLGKKKIHAIPNSRAVELVECLDNTRADNSLVIPISRGGETLDINSTIGIFANRGYKFLGLSSRGTMHEILKSLNSPILDVPDLSGRFAGSMTNVGIVPALIAGIDVNLFLNGIKVGYKEFMSFESNIALDFASFLFSLYEKNYGAIFSMPYSKNIEGSVGLFVQEISESTGKDGKGFIGTYQEAPLCQHSVLEYLLGGKKGIVIPIIWLIEKEVPDLILDSTIDFINGQSAQTIVNYQANATFQAFIEQGIPSAKISVKSPDEYSIGNLISLIQSVVYYLCLLLDVNWSDNPKVVIGKKICNEALKAKKTFTEWEQERKKIAKLKYGSFFH